MSKNKMINQMLSVMLVFVFLLQPMCFQAQEDLTKKATNVNILVQEPMNALFQQEEGKDATVETLEYSYWFDENKGDELTADVDVMIDMTVCGMAYEIEANGEVSGEKLSSGSVLWMGPLEGLIEINNIEYLVMVGFTKMDELVQISVTIQSKDDKNVIEAVRFSFGDNVITEDVYQEIMGENEAIAYGQHVDRYPVSTTYAMNSRSILNQPQLEGGSGGLAYPFRRIKLVSTNFASGPTSEKGQTLYGYFDESTDRVAVAIRTYCSNLKNYYKSIGNTSTYIESMKYTIKRGKIIKSRISGMESYDFVIKNHTGTGLIMALFSDVITMLQYPIPMSTLTELSSNNVTGTVNEKCYDEIAYVDIKFAATEHANFDKATGGMPIVFSLDERDSSYEAKHDYCLMSSIKYRSIVETGTVPRPIYTVYYDAALDATCEINVDLDE